MLLRTTADPGEILRDVPTMLLTETCFDINLYTDQSVATTTTLETTEQASKQSLD